MKLNMTDLGEVLGAFSGCKDIQTKASNEQQAQPPAPQASGVGEFTDFEQNGKKKKTTGATDQWLDCSPHHRLTVVPLQFLDMKQEIKSSSLYSPRITEGTN